MLTQKYTVIQVQKKNRMKNFPQAWSEIDKESGRDF